MFAARLTYLFSAQSLIRNYYPIEKLKILLFKKLNKNDVKILTHLSSVSCNFCCLISTLASALNQVLNF